MTPPLPNLAVTPGDPDGIGPEISAKVCSDPTILLAANITILGDSASICDAFQRYGNPAILKILDNEGERCPTGMCGLYDAHAKGLSVDPAPEVTAIRSAVEGCLSGQYDAMVTGPIDKNKLLELGFQFPGHTHFLSNLTGSPRPVMTFVSQSLRVSLVTDHIPLGLVPKHVTKAAIVQALKIVEHDLKRWYGIESPKIAVCGLNPHAGESGHLGQEDLSVVTPAILEAQSLGILASGPHPSDTVFAKAIAGEFDLVLALYHDQGLIPIKLLGLGSAVHLTFGLPILRTSVDHGTAKDIAGQGIANSGGMKAAVLEAISLVARH